MDRRDFLRRLGGATVAGVAGIVPALPAAAQAPPRRRTAPDIQPVTLVTVRWRGTSVVLEVANPNEQDVDVPAVMTLVDPESGLVLAEMPQVQNMALVPHEVDELVCERTSQVEWGRFTP